jgi:hypothetical protein
MNKLFRMIYLLILLSLNFSCVEKKPTEKGINKLKNVRTSKNDTLKFTLNALSSRQRQLLVGSHQEGVSYYDGKHFNISTILMVYLTIKSVP